MNFRGKNKKKSILIKTSDKRREEGNTNYRTSKVVFKSEETKKVEVQKNKVILP